MLKQPGLGNVESLRTGGCYILTLDITRLLNGLKCLTRIPQNVTERFNSSVIQALRDELSQTIPLVVIRENPFYSTLENMLDAATEKAAVRGALVVNLDRFIAPGCEQTENFSIISVGRFSGGEKEVIIERPGNPPLKEQMRELTRTIDERGLNRKVVIIDDGLATRDCYEDYKLIFDQQGLQIVGFWAGIAPYGGGEWAAVEGVKEAGCQEVVLLVPSFNTFDWVCERDFTIFGGKMWRKSPATVYTAPYFYPFTDGKSASIPPESLKTFSRRIIEANIKLLNGLEQSGNPTPIFKDIVSAGYGIPICLDGSCRSPKIDEPVKNYLVEILNEANL